MRKRQYRQRKRAVQQEETRQRIVDAAMALHGEVGPRNTSIKAVAERAGVERLTVYRHFPNQETLFQACTGHWIRLNPPPDPACWAGIDDSTRRRREILGRLYDYFHATSSIWTLSWRDRDEVKALQQPMAEFDRYLDGLVRDIVSGDRNWEASVTARHLVTFSTWKSLEEQGLSNAAKVKLALRWLSVAAETFADHE